jgi:Zn-dependent protease with chaperone function
MDLKLETTNLFILESQIPNAYACGFNKKGSAVYITSGLLSKFNNNCKDRRLQAIIAHELGHIVSGHMKIDSAIKVLEILGNTLTPVIVESYKKEILEASKRETNNKKNYNEKYYKENNKYKREYEQNKQKQIDEENEKNAKFFKTFLLNLIKIFQIIFFSSISRQLEYEADAIATKAGHGKSLSDGLLTIHDEKYEKHNNFTEGCDSYLNELGSNHPDLINRVIAIDLAMLQASKQEYEEDNVLICFFDSLKYTFSRFLLEITSHFNKKNVYESLTMHRIKRKNNKSLAGYCLNSVRKHLIKYYD